MRADDVIEVCRKFAPDGAAAPRRGVALRVATSRAAVKVLVSLVKEERGEVLVVSARVGRIADFHPTTLLDANLTLLWACFARVGPTVVLRFAAPLAAVPAELCETLIGRLAEEAQSAAARLACPQVAVHAID